MNHDVIITCALTGAGDTTARSPHVPVTPKQIAAAAVEAAKAGATVVHCHGRDPQTGKFSRDVALYREVMERIREADVDIIVNLTAGTNRIRLTAIGFSGANLDSLTVR